MALAPREREIAALLAQGKTQRQIAHMLGISYETARTHIKRARQKTQCDTAIELAVKFVLLSSQ